jgi:hypothetical protein
MMVPMTEHLSVSDEERRQLVSYVMASRKDFLQDLMEAVGVAKSGIKADLRARLEEALEAEPSRLGKLIAFLDRREPWGRQQVELLEVPSRTARQWGRTSAELRAALEAADGRATALLDEPEDVGLPDELRLTAISIDGQGTVEFRAIERRRYFERDPKLDYTEERAEGDVRYRAQVERVARGVLTIRMRPRTRTASVHISQGDSSYDYGTARSALADEIAPWLDLEALKTVDLRPAVAALHALEDQARRGGPLAPTRAHRLAIRLPSGAQVSLSSPSADAAMVGDSVIDDTVGRAKGAGGTGQIGNVYFTPGSGNPVSQEIHVIVAAVESRIHIRNPSEEPVVSHIVDTVRGLC